VRAEQRSLAAMHSHAPSVEQAPVVDPSGPLFKLPPHPNSAAASNAIPSLFRRTRMGPPAYQSIPCVAQAARHAANGDGTAGPAQSQTVQKPQSISEHDPVVFRFARQVAVHAAFVPVPVQMLAMYWTNGWPTHLACTADSSLAHEPAPALFSHPRNLPPPHTQTLPGKHSVGHQQASERGVQRSEAARQSHALSSEQGGVGALSPHDTNRPPPHTQSMIESG